MVATSAAVEPEADVATERGLPCTAVGCPNLATHAVSFAGMIPGAHAHPCDACLAELRTWCDVEVVLPMSRPGGPCPWPGCTPRPIFAAQPPSAPDIAELDGLGGDQ